ncbi:MAG: TIGR04086 family membrane protein [Eubacteriales bacterium]|nr:TIGR04086 family membrane protein [Eubacteriales bacterium]
MKYRTVRILKALMGGYIITIILLLLLSFALYKFNISNWLITTGIIITYALSCFLGGLFLASGEKHKKLLWGLLFGILYYAILAIASTIISKGAGADISEASRSLIVCVIASLTGGFASP